MADKDSPQKFNPEVYTKITLNALLVYSIHYLHKRGGEITSEDVISACFTLFPQRFALRKYPYWPDSAVVCRRWNDCRAKGYIVGSPAQGFKLTPKGFRFAEKVGRMLGGTRLIRRRIPAEVKTRAGRFVRSMEKSEAFLHYRKNGRHARISEFDFRSMLLCTMESSPATLARNLEQFKDYAGIYDRQDMLTFLNFCEEWFSHLLDSGKKQPHKAAHKRK